MTRVTLTAITTDRLIQAALAEDIGAGDVTTRLTVPASLSASARIVARQGGTLAGIDISRRVFHAVDRRIRFAAWVADGAGFAPGDIVARVSGPARSILTAERTALNFLRKLSGIATLTRRYVDAVDGTGATILDTRKTTPGWRTLEKRAVRSGGGSNHRAGLYDMVLVKDNHIAAAGGVTAALESTLGARLPVEIEVRTLAELREALDAGAKRILLDNMTPALLRKAVVLTKGRAELEASGGIDIRSVRAVARTGVNYISVGALTHSAPAADLALDFD